MTEYIKYFPAPFLEDMVRGRVLPFVGAGFSLNAKVPPGKKMLDWDGLGKRAASALPEYQYTTAIEALSSYSQEFSRIKLVEFLSSALHVATIQPGSAHEEFCRLPFERVVTTNFDFLLEQAYSRINSYCIPLVAEDQLAVSDPQAAVRLLKIHGDLHHPNRLVVTEEDYDSFVNRLPLLATHLASLLIDNTAFFVGYSLDDPDFRQIWQVVKERLGELRRPAYVLQVAAPTHVVTRYERRGVKVINLPRSHGRSYAEVLQLAFGELREHWASQLLALSTSTELEPQAELSLPASAHGRLAFFAVPTRYAAIYKSRIYPIAERFGFSPVMAAEVVAPGDNLMAKVSALIEKSAVVVADLSSPNTVFEVGVSISKDGGRKPLIVIADENASIPFDVSNQFNIRRPSSLDDDSSHFIKDVEYALESAFSLISPALDDEPSRLLDKKEYRAAVIAAFSLLEHEVRQRLQFFGSDAAMVRAPVTVLLDQLTSRNVLTARKYSAIRGHLSTRNNLVHTQQNVTANAAKTIVRDVSEAVALIRSHDFARPAQ